MPLPLSILTSHVVDDDDLPGLAGSIRSMIREEVGRRESDRQASGGGGGSPSQWNDWIKLVIAVGTIIISVTLAYGQLDKRIALMEQKIDSLAQQVQRLTK